MTNYAVSYLGAFESLETQNKPCAFLQRIEPAREARKGKSKITSFPNKSLKLLRILMLCGSGFVVVQPRGGRGRRSGRDGRVLAAWRLRSAQRREVDRHLLDSSHRRTAARLLVGSHLISDFIFTLVN